MDSRYNQGTLPVYSGALRQRGAGIGSLLGGISRFVIPLARKYALPIGKEFIRNAVPELVNVLEGKSKPKSAIKRATIKTVRKQVGGGRRGVARKTSKRKKRTTISKTTRGRSSNRRRQPKKLRGTSSKQKLSRKVGSKRRQKPVTSRSRPRNILSSVRDAQF